MFIVLFKCFPRSKTTVLLRIVTANKSRGQFVLTVLDFQGLHHMDIALYDDLLVFEGTSKSQCD